MPSRPPASAVCAQASREAAQVTIFAELNSQVGLRCTIKLWLAQESHNIPTILIRFKVKFKAIAPCQFTHELNIGATLDNCCVVFLVNSCCVIDLYLHPVVTYDLLDNVAIR